MTELHDGQQLLSRVDIVDGHPVVFMPLTKSELAWAYREPVEIARNMGKVALPQLEKQGE